MNIQDVLPTGEGFSQKVYNFLKWFTLIFLPALATLYFALSGTWDLPNPEAVMGTITSVATFLGVLLGVSNKNYNQSGAGFDGEVVVDTAEDGKTIFSLDYNGDPDEIPTKDKVSFKVVGGDEQFWGH